MFSRHFSDISDLTVAYYSIDDRDGDRLEEPEIIIDPVSGMVIAIIHHPAQPTARPVRRERDHGERDHGWQAVIARWRDLVTAGLSLLVTVPMGRPDVRYRDRR